MLVHEATRDWKLPPGLRWDDALRYVLTQWISSGLKVTKYWATLQTGRTLTAEVLDELLSATRDIQQLVTTLAANLTLSEFTPAKRGVRTEDLHDEDTVGFLYVLFGEGTFESRAVTIQVRVDCPSVVPAEGMLSVLAKAVDEWLLANTRPSGAVGTVSAPEIDAAPKLPPSSSTDPAAPTTRSSTLSWRPRAFLSGLAGLSTGATVMSVIAYGFDKGPTVPLTGWLTALVISLLVYRFGLGR